MATEYCDRYTYKAIYGHYPPEDGSLDPALGAQEGETVIESEREVVAKMVTPSGPAKFDMQTSDVAETKTADPEPDPVAEAASVPEE